MNPAKPDSPIWRHDSDSFSCGVITFRDRYSACRRAHTPAALSRSGMFDGALITGADPVDLRGAVLDEVPAEAARARSAIGRALEAGTCTSGHGSASSPSTNARDGRRRSPGGTGTGRSSASGQVLKLWPAATRSSRVVTTGDDHYGPHHLENRHTQDRDHSGSALVALVAGGV